MASYGSMAVAALLGAMGTGCSAFVHPSLVPGRQASSTELYIIGPMLRKMREEEAKKKMPMASDEERSFEAPGLRVGSAAWKWPPIWPYDEDMFKRKDEIPPSPTTNPMSLMGGGMPKLPAVLENIPIVEEDRPTLDVLRYWGEEKADATTDIDVEAMDRLTNHYAFYLRDGMSILELGAAENSYLPDDLNLARHVGVGANRRLMEINSALTQTIVADLNDVEKDKGIHSNDIKSLGTNAFDVILMANTIDFLTSPREVYKSAWQLLKPGGLMMVAFTNKEAYTNKFEKAQTKMWLDMNDDQHMWIAGSFFQFSAGDGWENLKGFDISPIDARKENEGLLSKLSLSRKPMNMYVCQATKGYQDESIDEYDPEKSFRSVMWMLPTLEERDKQLVAPRLARSYQFAKTREAKDAIVSHVEVLPKVYDCLIKMDQYSFPFSMQAQLAADLITDPDFVANDEQIVALKMGLGLRKPSSDFWAPVGQMTADMDTEEKVNLLAHIVPRFGSGNHEQEAALEAFVSGLKPTFDVIRSKCVDGMSESDVQLIGTELLAAEVLLPKRSTREEFASWVGALTEEELKEYLSARKSVKESAIADRKRAQEIRASEISRIEEQRKKMMEQVEVARKERTMVFNPATGKMEELSKKKK